MSDRRSVRLAAAVSSILSAPAMVAGAALVTSFGVVPVAVAQETTTQMTGYVVDQSGSPVAGAQVIILHVPTGTTSTATTGASGSFNATGLRPGGPYRVIAKAAGQQDASLEDVYTQLGQRNSVTMVTQNLTQLAGVEVTGSSERDASIGGTRFSAEDVRALPSISRDIKDIVRTDPKISLDPNNFDAMEIAGVNNRYNSITVDGVRQSDDFGLNNNGYPTQRAPISMDAIQAVSVLTAPFNVEYSHFRGSTINVVTKSGGNEFTGSAFYYDTGDSRVGDRTKNRTLTFQFEEETYGATLGGPIIKDKLFFFLSYDKLDRLAPDDFGPTGSGAPIEVPGISQADYNQIVSIARNVYGFDPGDVLGAVPEDDEKYLVKLDWNINDSHRASLAWQHTEGNQTSITNRSSSQRRLSTPSGLYNRAITMDSYSFQLFSDWNDLFSTELKVARKEIETRQDSLKGTDFAEFQVNARATTALPSAGTVFIGPDEFRHANYLTNDLDTIKFKSSWFLGDHTVTAGYEREMLDIFNVFVPRSRGQYIFNSIADFQNRSAAQLVYNNAFSNNSDEGAAAFSYDVDSLYVQDQWQVTPDLSITAGVRFDKWSSDDTPSNNTTFGNRYGFSNLETLDGRDLVMPRIGFNWQWRPETRIFGGWGLFGGGTPNVWVSNSFSVDGVTVVEQRITPTSTIPATCTSAIRNGLNNVDGFNINPAVLSCHTTLRGDGPVNAIDPAFEVPSQYRWNLGVSHELPWEIQLNAEAIISRVKNEVNYVDLRLVQTGTAPDGRPIYSRRTGFPSGQDFLLTNTTEGEGEVYSIDLSKSWRTRAGRFDAYIGYAYQDIKDVNSGTSSTASSNWDNLAVSDPNDPGLATSNYEIPHSFKLALNWRKAFWSDYETSIALVGERRSGRHYSYTFGSQSTMFGDPRQGSRSRALLYVPIAGDGTTYAGGLTEAAMNAFIEQQGLERYRGMIVPRNSHSSPWVSIFDLRFAQEIPVWSDKVRGIATLDIENVANLINSDWGQFRSVGFHYVAPAVNARLNTAGKYEFFPISGTTPQRPNFSLGNAQQSVWRMQLGFRLEF